MIWVKKESDVIDLMLKLIGKIEECLRAGMDTIDHYLKAEIDEAKEMAKKTDHLETETDEIRREVEGLLFSGAFLPSLRGDVHVLVEAMDKIADSAEACCDFAMGQRPEVPEDFKSDFHKVTVDSIYSYDPLKEAAENLFSEKEKDVSIIRERIRDVGIRESDVDDLEWKLTRRIFTSDLPLAQKLHLQHWLEKITNISDRVEDTSDWLNSLIFKAQI
jgi:predicted phosphate transport protein (TIGR00153 family)